MKLLFFDIDGTLVSFRTHAIPESTVDALRHARRNGHKVIIATGRPTPIINNLGALQCEGLIDGYVTMNGAYCYAGNEVLYARPIDSGDVALIAQRCHSDGTPCIFVHEHSMCEAGGNELSHEIFGVHLNAPDIPPTDYFSPTLQPVFQITPFFDENTEAQIARQTPGCEYGRWHPAFVDITAKGVTKALGIDIFCRHFGTDIADTVSFGDGGNDIPMLLHAGTGVAMGNAAETVKKAADHTTASVDDDGIAIALKMLHLI